MLSQYHNLSIDIDLNKTIVEVNIKPKKVFQIGASIIARVQSEREMVVPFKIQKMMLCSFQGNKVLGEIKNLTLDTNETLDSNSEIYDDDGSGLAESLVFNAVLNRSKYHMVLHIS